MRQWQLLRGGGTCRAHNLSAKGRAELVGKDFFLTFTIVGEPLVFYEGILVAAGRLHHIAVDHHAICGSRRRAARRALKYFHQLLAHFTFVVLLATRKVRAKVRCLLERSLSPIPARRATGAVRTDGGRRHKLWSKPAQMCHGCCVPDHTSLAVCLFGANSSGEALGWRYAAAATTLKSRRYVVTQVTCAACSHAYPSRCGSRPEPNSKIGRAHV